MRFGDDFAVLKVLSDKGRIAEGSAGEVLRYFDGDGAVRVLRFDEGAQLLEFLEGPQLESLSLAGSDLQAAEVICEVVGKLHSSRAFAFPSLISLDENFRSLHLKASEAGVDSLLVSASQLARRLVGETIDPVVLHGDLHHENILRSASRGWVAIDPQGLIGDRHYDLANFFFNPEGFSEAETAERIRSYARLFSTRLALDEKRILKFAFVHGCLSTCWSLQDGKDPSRRLRISRTIFGLL